MIRFSDEQVYNQIARWVSQKKIHTIKRYFSRYPEQLELAGMGDLLLELKPTVKSLGNVSLENEMEDLEGLNAKRLLLITGKVALSVGGLFLLWKMARKLQRKR